MIVFWKEERGIPRDLLAHGWIVFTWNNQTGLWTCHKHRWRTTIGQSFVTAGSAADWAERDIQRFTA